jgi:hypothetical protein
MTANVESSQMGGAGKDLVEVRIRQETKVTLYLLRVCFVYMRIDKSAPTSMGNVPLHPLRRF